MVSVLKCVKRSTTAAPQSNSSFREVNHFRKTATGSKLRKRLLDKFVTKKQIFKEFSDVIRIRMNRLIFILFRFEMCHVNMPDLVVAMDRIAATATAVSRMLV